MKLTLNNSRHKNTGYKNITPSFVQKNKTNSLQFRGISIEKITSGQNGEVTYTNMLKAVNFIDDLLGDKFFTKHAENIGINLSEQSQNIILKDSSFFIDFYKTIRYPLLDMPLDIANWFLRLMEKIKPLKNMAQKGLSSKVLSKRAHTVQIEKSREIVQDILTSFTDPLCEKVIDSGKVSYDLDFCKKMFIQKGYENLKKTSKNYNSRDERTLNRLVTSMVSALYGARDFYNISMLQKDNKKEAKKAEKSRFKQEATRGVINSVMTFFSLGVLNKYIRNSLPLTVATIVGSALFAEISSRVINKVPLKPLTPKKAEKIAKIKKMSSNKSKTQNLNEKQDQKNISFKNIPKNENVENLYSKFLNDKNSKFLNNFSNNNFKKETNNTEKTNHKNKKLNIKKIASIAFGSASLLYLMIYFLGGKFREDKIKKIFVTSNYDKLKDYAENKTDILDDQLARSIKNKTFINSKKKPKSIFGIYFENLRRKINKILKGITNKQVVLSNKDVLQEVDKMIEADSENIYKSSLRYYQRLLHEKNKVNPNSTQVFQSKKTIISGFVNGFKKIFETAWYVLTAPGVLVKNAIEKLSFEETNQIYNRVSKKIDVLNNKIDFDDGSLHKIFKKAKDPQKALKEYISSIRAFGSGGETGEIANFSRAFVTLISSYFFVNDYYNKVLIESEGKNIEEAEEERNERIAHKLSNFVVNGTLMNIFNSVFNKALNNSLIQAMAIAGVTEATNEFLVRKSICQPVKRMKSKDEIIEWEEKQTSKKGLMGIWSRFFRKITGKKTLTEKAHIDIEKEKIKKEQKAKNT